MSIGYDHMWCEWNFSAAFNIFWQIISHLKIKYCFPHVCFLKIPFELISSQYLNEDFFSLPEGYDFARGLKKETWNFVYIDPCHRWLVQWGKTALTKFVKTERKMYAYCFKTLFWENGLADFGCPKRIRCVSARRIYVLLTVLPDFLLITGLRQFFSESAFVNNIPPPPHGIYYFFCTAIV